MTERKTIKTEYSKLNECLEKFDNKEKEKWIPLVQVRHIDTEIEE